MTRRASVGLMVVEVLVALAVLSINVVGWVATVQLVAVLLQRIAQLLASIDAVEVTHACSLSVLAIPRKRLASMGRPASDAVLRPRSLRRAPEAGLTLVEILITLALSALVFTLVAGSFASTSRFARAALELGDALTVRLAVPTMVRQAIEVAGRGLAEACGIRVDAGGQRVAVTFRHRDGSIVVDEVFAGLDGGGRPALYLRRIPHARQPWIENVTSFVVHDLRLDADGRVAALEAQIEHRALDEPLAFSIALPHRPCLEEAS